jgi:membrane protease YdiL (CAAX protease family)
MSDVCPERRATIVPVLIVAASAAALAVRVQVGGRPAGASVPAALVFSFALAGVAVAAGWRPSRPRPVALVAGAAGGVLLCLPPTIASVRGFAVGHAAAASFPAWGAVVAAVAVSEELILRGVLYDVVAERWGEIAAVLIAAALFSTLHVPLYGWHSFGLNLAVGVFLGVLRLLTGGVAAPAVAHTVADWAAWWLR